MRTLTHIVLLLLASTACAGPFPDKYDAAIKGAWALYHPGDDSRWWKAQLWQESHLDPNALSPANALGIAQFVQATAMQYGLTDRRAAEPSIYAGAKLMRDNMRFWSAPRTDRSRRRLAQAGYNAGNGNLWKAQKRCGGLNEYESIVSCLPLITGKYAKETLGYPVAIEKWFWRMQ